MLYVVYVYKSEMREIFDKNPFILGTKLNVLNYVLMRVEREVQFP